MALENNKNSIEGCVAEAIREGRVKMRPRWHFIVHGTLILIGVILLALTLLFLISLIIFSLRHSGAGFGPAYGTRGWFIFARSLPWMLILIAFMFIFVLEFIARRHPIAYRRPLLYSAVGIVVLAIGGGFIVAGTSLHPKMMRYAEKHKLPIGQSYYRGLAYSEIKDVYPGIVTATTTDGVLIRSRRGDLLMITFTPETSMPSGGQFLPNQPVMIFGERVASDTVRAFGIRLIANTGNF